MIEMQRIIFVDFIISLQVSQSPFQDVFSIDVREMTSPSLPIRATNQTNDSIQYLQEVRPKTVRIG